MAGSMTAALRGKVKCKCAECRGDRPDFNVAYLQRNSELVKLAKAGVSIKESPAQLKLVANAMSLLDRGSGLLSLIDDAVVDDLPLPHVPGSRSWGASEQKVSPLVR